MIPGGAKSMSKSRCRSQWKKIVFVVLITVVCTFTFAWDMVFQWQTNTNALSCYEFWGNKLPELDESEPKFGFGIYFHETACREDRWDIALNARQSCSIESALRAHFDTDVFLLISSPIHRRLHKTKNIYVQELLKYPNFKVRHITFSKYLSNTPLYSIYQSGALNYSLWPTQHASDVLRYATLYKFGGLYLDLDVLVLKPLLGLQSFAGIESKYGIGSAVLGFGSDRAGREVAKACVKELASTYDFKIWGFNGPGVITRVLQRRCDIPDISNMYKGFCDDFHVYPPEYFYAVPFDEGCLLFQEARHGEVVRMLNQSYAIHLWNQRTQECIVNGTGNTPFLHYARKHCPRVYEVGGGNFTV